MFDAVFNEFTVLIYVDFSDYTATDPVRVTLSTGDGICVILTLLEVDEALRDFQRLLHYLLRLFESRFESAWLFLRFFLLNFERS